MSASDDQKLAETKAAKDAAEVAVRSARRANIIAVAALVVAIIAAAVTVIPLLSDQADPLSTVLQNLLDSI